MIEIDEHQLALANAFRLASLASLMDTCRSRSVEHGARSKNQSFNQDFQHEFVQDSESDAAGERLDFKKGRFSDDELGKPL